jgi:hypothetical protein
MLFDFHWLCSLEQGFLKWADWITQATIASALVLILLQQSLKGGWVVVGLRYDGGAAANEVGRWWLSRAFDFIVHL